MLNEKNNSARIKLALEKKKMESRLTNNAVGFVRGVGALGDAVASLSAGVDAGAVAAAERIGPRTRWGQTFGSPSGRSNGGYDMKSNRRH